MLSVFIFNHLCGGKYPYCLIVILIIYYSGHIDSFSLDDMFEVEADDARDAHDRPPFVGWFSIAQPAHNRSLGQSIGQSILCEKLFSVKAARMKEQVPDSGLFIAGLSTCSKEAI
jgi:hypothetical protein